MKTIKTLIEIPAKFKWMAQDESGLLFFYVKKPQINEKMQWWRNSGGETLCIEDLPPNPNWRNTLKRIEEYEEV